MSGSAELAPQKSFMEPARNAFAEEQRLTIRRAIAPELNDNEFEVFLEIAAQYGLDPFRGEIWPAKMQGRFVPIVGRDGMLSIAQRHRDYRGWEGDVVREHDTFRKTNEKIEHSYELGGGDESKVRGKIIGAWARVHREGRVPTYYYAAWGEYNLGRATWKSHPSAMILKAALANALRLAFNLSGLYVEEEMGKQVTALDEPPLEPDFGDDELGERLRALVDAANEAKPGSYRPAKVRMMLEGATDEERAAFAETLAREIGEDGVVDAEVVPEEPAAA